MIPTSVRVNNRTGERLPVNSDAPLPKNLISDAMTVIRNIEVTPPVKSGEIIIENILNTGVNIISTKSLQG
jgi:CxxC motif-containing protein